MDLARRVASRRKEQHITQRELARRSDVSLGSIKRFEQTGEVSLSSLMRIAVVLGYERDFDALFERKSYSSIEEIIRGQS